MTLREWVDNAQRLYDVCAASGGDMETQEDEDRLYFELADWAASYGPALLRLARLAVEVVEASKQEESAGEAEDLDLIALWDAGAQLSEALAALRRFDPEGE